MIFLAGDLLAVMSPHHHHSSSRGRIARAGCHQTTRMLCGMRSDGLEANVTLHVASPEQVDSLEIEDATAQNLRSAQTPLPPRTDPFGATRYLATNTHMSEFTGGATGVSIAPKNSFFAISCEILSRYLIPFTRAPLTLWISVRSSMTRGLIPR